MGLLLANADNETNPCLWGVLMIIGMVLAIFPRVGWVLNGAWMADDDGEPSGFALAASRAVGIVLAIWGGLVLLAGFNT